MSLYLEIAAGRVMLPEDEVEMGQLVVALLNQGNDWVRARSDCHHNWLTQWTVLERNEKGEPVSLASEDFDGESEVLTAGTNG